MSEQQLTVMLAGPGHEGVIYQMQPAFLHDARFNIVGTAQNWENLQDNLPKLKPEMLILQADLAPGPDALQVLLRGLLAWSGRAMIILPPSQAGFKGAIQSMEAVVSGVYLAPISWTDIAGLAYGAGITAQAKLSSVSPASSFGAASDFGASALNSFSPLVTGTKRIAVLSQAGGAGASTIAENLGYELATRLSVKALLFSLGMPPAASAHFKLRYVPNLTEFFERPGKPALQAAIQRVEGLEILLAPEDSIEYATGVKNSADVRAPNSIYSSLLAAEDGSYGALIMDLPSDESEWMIHSLLFANVALLVYRPILADLFAARHTLNMLNRLGKLPREATYLVLNQASENSSLTPRAFQQELSQALGWAPPIIAVIDADPNVLAAQEQRLPAVLRSEKLSKGLRQIIGALFPGMERAASAPQDSGRSIFRLPKLRFG